ncbi:hypothetical protein D5F11_011500 [Siminovitchia terrae]|uniref:Uncharacterized protein n=1 Tax=Siminovitchia terrae TaxID=1914933 RepID=A0A429X8T2_SIMTE|nr:hypothetical protein [Siminovitchia terrae]RST59720.1 hypothetical protein D5F11_011500 [Siminovitchia terrae]
MKVLPYEQDMRLAFNNDSIRLSFQKLKEAIQSTDNQEVYTAIGELLLWVVTTDEWHIENGLADYKERKGKDEDGKILYGMRHAFNCLKHNMSFFQIHHKKGGLEYPITSPLETKEITILWMPAGNILNGKHESQKKNYIKYVEGREVVETFKSAITFLNKEFAKVTFN